VKSTELRNQAISAEKGQVVGPPTGENGAEPSVVDVYRISRISCVDRATGDEVWFVMTEELKDELVRQLTGGIVLAGGKLPKVP
jgi:hypothetical protein